MKLPRPRLTVRRLMVAVAIVALDFGLIRGMEELVTAETSRAVPLILTAYTLVPSLSLLIMAAVSAGVGIARRRVASPFSSGYLLMGGLSSFGMCLGLATESYWPFLETVRVPVQEPSLMDQRIAVLLLIAVLALPQVVPALIGGGLATRYGLRIALDGHSGPH